MDNIKEALEYAVGLANPEIHEIGNEIFSTKQLHRIDEKKNDLVKPLQVATLTGFIDYITENKDRLDYNDVMIQITDTNSVRLVSVPNKDRVREIYIEADACLPSIGYGKWYGLEDFNVLLQAAFEQTNDRDTLLKYVSHVKAEEGITLTDDGVSQKVVTKTGVASVDNVILPNPVILKPYRTFQEVAQTESAFVFRLDKNGNCALFEADGGVWKIRCRETVKEYLRQNLNGDDTRGITIIG